MKRTCENQDCPETVGTSVVAVTDTARMATDVCLAIGLAAAESTNHWQF